MTLYIIVQVFLLCFFGSFSTISKYKIITHITFILIREFLNKKKDKKKIVFHLLEECMLVILHLYNAHQSCKTV